jgi:BirA family biotin operon repressor/biotin-[acetyl-CoA-carboxylase] ligase
VIPAPVLPDGWTLVALETVASTNDEAGRLAEAGAAEGTVVWARTQSGGRGRVGGLYRAGDGKLY